MDMKERRERNFRILEFRENKFDIIGNDSGLVRAIETAVAVAPTELTVLITGESGVGKEFFPKIVHTNSVRKHGKYIAVNCILIFAIRKCCRKLHCIGFESEIDYSSTLVPSVDNNGFTILRDADIPYLAVHSLTELVDCDHFRMEELIISTSSKKVVTIIIIIYF